MRYSLVAGPRTNVWSSTFDPGRNANLRKAGSSYYDKPIDNKAVWDYHVESEGSKPKTVTEKVSAQSGGGGESKMDAEAMRRMLASDRVEAALLKADPTGQGKVDFNQVMSYLRGSGA